MHHPADRGVLPLIRRVCDEHLGFYGFVQFIVNAVSVVNAQLLQEERPQREFVKNLVHVSSACLLLFRLTKHETPFTVKFLGMTGMRFRSTVRPSGARSDGRRRPGWPL